MTSAWPFCTSSAPIVGRYKLVPEDFVVDELPAYAPSGEGEHLLLRIRKRGLSTHDAVARIARALGLAPAQIGVAGLKDAQGVTTQWLSVQGVEAQRVEALKEREIELLELARHRNKLRIGHLRGNRFRIRLREVAAEDFERVRSVLDELARRGVPNYFGEQRFGQRGDTWRIGRALLLEQWSEALAWLCGRPGPHDTGRIRRARELFDAGDFEAAAQAWPGGFRVCIRVCRALAKSRDAGEANSSAGAAGQIEAAQASTASPGALLTDADAASLRAHVLPERRARRALYAIDHGLLRFYTSAYQSWLFNALLARRIDSFERVELGDLAWLHRNGAVFLVKDLEVDAPRAERLEISPSGPLFGSRMSTPQGRALELEHEVLAAEGHALEAFTRPGRLQWQGGRRPLRFPLAEVACESGQDERGSFVELRFDAPPGCYATSVLRELFKRDDVALDAASDDGDD